MRYRLPAIAIVLGIVATACAGAASPSAPTAPASQAGASQPVASAPVEKVNLTLRHCWGGDGEIKAMETIVAAWNAKNPDIQVKAISGSLENAEVAADVAGGTPPDMFIMCNNGAVAGFAHDGVILQLDDLLKANGADTSDITSVALGWTSYQGKLYGLPFGQDTFGLYYNTDAFTEVGLDPAKPPQTIDELWTYAEKLTKYNADGSLARLGFVPDDPDKNLSMTSQLFGCQFYDEAAKKVSVNSPACAAWFDWYKSWYDKYNKGDAMTKLVASRGNPDGGLLYSGKLAMVIIGEWVTGKSYAPTLAPDLKYETAPIPALSADVYGAGFVGGNTFLIPKGAKNPAASAKFGMYLETADPNRTMALQNASVPSLKSMETDATLTAIPHFGTFLKIANHPKAWSNPMIAQWGQFSDGLSSALDSVLHGGVASQKALDDLAAQIQADLDSNGP
jgi:multiple sugar transport system substrate-binding protein